MCIVDCGPAGAVLGLILARAGVEVVVLEARGPGLPCIGDAAHAMSPVAGINLAIQDAAAAANLLAEPLLRGALGTRDLARVQRRRSLPTRVTQNVQRLMQQQIVSAAGDPDKPTSPPSPADPQPHSPTPAIVLALHGDRHLQRARAAARRTERAPAPAAVSG